MTALVVAGKVPFSTVDMPGRNAAVLFCQGCPWRCRYCHNPHLRPSQPAAQLAWPELLRWLEPRRGFLDAVVFTGGEPLLQAGLPQAMEEIKAMGFGIGLHTGGCLPQALRAVLPLLDWIGLDIKAPRHAYQRITGAPGSGAAAWESLALSLRSSVPTEVRTTCHPDLLSEPELTFLAGELARSGATDWVLQAFRTQGCADPDLAAAAAAPLGDGLVRRLEAIFLGAAPARDAVAPRPHPGTDRPHRRFLAR